MKRLPQPTVCSDSIDEKIVNDKIGFVIIAPEVLYGQEYSHSADWWTLGILMYTLLTGEFPINGARDHREMGAAVARYTYMLPERYDLDTKLVITKV